MRRLQQDEEPDENGEVREKVAVDKVHAAKEESLTTVDKVEELELPEAVAKNVSMPNVTALENTNNLGKAAMMFNDAALHRANAPNQSWYGPYQITLLLLVLIHFIYILQWNRRKTRKDVLVSYKILVHKKHFHKGVVAFLSHPAADAASSSSSNYNNNRSSRSVSFGNDESNDSSGNHDDNTRRRRRCFSLLKRAWSSVSVYMQPLTTGHLSGLPLLAYNSHLLWLCRALEPMYPQGQYAIMWIGLTLVALLLELRLSHNVLQLNRTPVGFGSRNEARRAVLNRTIGTLTMLTSALLVVYRGAFPFVTIKVLPFMPWTVKLDPTFAFWICIILLAALSWRSHPVTSVLCGTMSGLLWTAGITSFLATKYWGHCLLVVLITMCALSMRSSSHRLAKYVPCIDYVAWDHRGVMRQEEQGQFHENDNEDEQDHDSQSSVADNGDIESRPLMGQRRRSGSRSSNMGDDEIHGRVPYMDMDSEIDDMQVPTGGGGTRTPGLSRRGGGGGGNSGHAMDSTPNHRSPSHRDSSS